MAEVQTQCQFKLPADESYQCGRRVENYGLCIFHVLSSEAIEAEMLESIEETFRESFRELLEEMEKGDEEEWNFRSFIFPSINLSNQVFTKKLVFRDAIFKKQIDFLKTRFKAEANFYDVTFNEAANFHGAIFNSRTKFDRANFHAEAKFSSVTFNAEHSALFTTRVSFTSAEFHGLANFSGGVFNTKTSFKDAKFRRTGSAHFGGAEFSADTSFYDATFEGEANFSWSTINNKVKFSGTENNKCFYHSCIFRYLNLDNEALLIFENVNLARARFWDTDLENIIFRDVGWYEITGVKLGTRRKNALYDEFKPPQETDIYFEKTAENYRQLVINYEHKRDFETAQSFHIGEMEIRRKKKGKLKWLNGYAVYRILSSYGTSYWQGFAVLLLMILFFSGIFLYTGFRPNKGALDNQLRVIEYDLWFHSNHQTVSFSADYVEAILFTLSIIPVQRERYYEPVGAWSQFWSFVAVLVLTSQAALVLLAIRRRFRR